MSYVLRGLLWTGIVFLAVVVVLMNWEASNLPDPSTYTIEANDYKYIVPIDDERMDAAVQIALPDAEIFIDEADEDKFRYVVLYGQLVLAYTTVESMPRASILQQKVGGQHFNYFIQGHVFYGDPDLRDHVRLTARNMFGEHWIHVVKGIKFEKVPADRVELAAPAPAMGLHPPVPPDRGRPVNELRAFFVGK